jgi:hypothetical protein
MLRRTNIYLDDRELAALRELGRRRNQPVASLVREAVGAWLTGQDVTVLGEEEWTTRFGELLERRRSMAAEGGFAEAAVTDDVERAVAEVRGTRSDPPARRC